MIILYMNYWPIRNENHRGFRDQKRFDKDVKCYGIRSYIRVRIASISHWRHSVANISHLYSSFHSNTTLPRLIHQIFIKCVGDYRRSDQMSWSLEILNCTLQVSSDAWIMSYWLELYQMRMLQFNGGIMVKLWWKY